MIGACFNGRVGYDQKSLTECNIMFSNGVGKERYTRCCGSILDS